MKCSNEWERRSAEEEKNRPFSLPPGEFRPKQSLGQNFLSDQNYVLKIVDSFRASLRAGKFDSEDDGGRRIVEIGRRLLDVLYYLILYCFHVLLIS